ncbi:HAD family hydrolase [Alistipes onderdonkii]|uniref:HAD family hydrolase n=1 Tax=Alistipes onderdonkii TaxID=328813 RepID=UPI001E52680B|nr:HAD family hydrolase [Alistipes onderdonkii]
MTTVNWKYLFFDLDGTLTDPMEGITRSVQYALRHFGIEVGDLRALCPFIGPPLRNSFREFYNMSDADAEVAVAKYREYYAPKGIFENRLYDGIPELLRDLRAHGATLVMATSKPTRFAEQIARHFGFADDFALISGSTPDGSRDAKADVIRHALATLGIGNPAEAVMIGDRRHDIQGAAATGLAAIGVLWGYGSREELENAMPAYIAQDIPALRNLLLG